MKQSFSVSAAALALAFAASAQAAPSDYLLEFDGVKGESAATAEVQSWSFGVCNVGQCSTPSQRTVITAREAGSGMATGKTGKGGKPSSATWDLATGKGARTTASGGLNVAAGDLDGDGAADFAYAGTQPEIYDLRFTFQKIEGAWREVCGGKHFDKVTLRSASDTFEITGATAACSSGGGAAAASYAATGRAQSDMPARISMNVTTPKQTQGATFGERCQAGVQCAGSAMTIALTGGQMKHTKTGHVTILK